MKNGKPNNPVSIRFSTHAKARLARLSQQLQVPAAEIVRRALESQLPAWERNGHSPGEKDGQPGLNGLNHPATSKPKKR
jgi:predicted transcriptional regulator